MRNLLTAILMTAVTTVLLGLIYPLAMTGIAQLAFPQQANGHLIQKDGVLIGSRIIGQPFTSPGYFYSRPSAAGPAGYDAGASTGSNLGPTNKVLIERIRDSVVSLQKDNQQSAPVPIDMVTTSGSGLDPDITPAAALFQMPRVARERGLSEAEVSDLIARHTTGRTFGVLGEPRVNVLLLNLELDERRPMNRK